MAQQIKLEIDQESFDEVKSKLVELYEIAEKASLAIEKAAQQGVHLTALRRGLALSIFINVVLLAVVLLIVGGR
jgi:hypothetical protein